jgi:transposase
MAKKKDSVEQTVRNIRRKTRKQYSSEEKIRIVLEGLRGESTVAELCRREGIAQSLYYKWSKEFLEAGKQRLAGNTKRQADSQEVSEMRQENEQLKQLVAELALKNRVLKKSLLGVEGETWDDCSDEPLKKSWRSSTWWSIRTYPSSEPWKS